MQDAQVKWCERLQMARFYEMKAAIMALTDDDKLRRVLLEWANYVEFEGEEKPDESEFI